MSDSHTQNGPTVHRLGIIMNGVTGRMGTNQHLIRSILAIRNEGGIRCSDGDRIIPEPLLVGRNLTKLQELAKEHGLDPSSDVSTDLDAALSDEKYQVYFDAQTTGRRPNDVKKAIQAGKHIYCEKPTAVSSKDALELHVLAEGAGVKHGVVQDKLWLPGLIKLQSLISSGFFGEILSVKGDFGYWVFDGIHMSSIKPQRPSWNYRKEDDGGIITDMLCHWRYVIHNLFGPIKSLSCFGATHLAKRVDEQGSTYRCTADDAAYCTFELNSGIIVQFNSSWTTRVRRDDLLTIQVDGTRGSAVATLRDCVIQHETCTPRPTWNPDVPSTIDHLAAWTRIPDNQLFDNAFKVQWEMFLKYVVKGGEWKYDLLEGAKGVQLTELGLESWARRAWVDVDEIKAPTQD